MTFDEYKEVVAQAIVNDDLDSIPELLQGADKELELEVKEALEQYKFEHKVMEMAK